MNPPLLAGMGAQVTGPLGQTLPGQGSQASPDHVRAETPRLTGPGSQVFSPARARVPPTSGEPEAGRSPPAPLGSPEVSLSVVCVQGAHARGPRGPASL